LCERCDALGHRPIAGDCGGRATTRSSLFRWPVQLYDRSYRPLHKQDRPVAQVRRALCPEVRRAYREHALPDGTVIRRGDRVGILHLNNARIATVHVNGLSLQAVGFEVRCWLLGSLDELARLATSSGPLATVRAFSATTIFSAALTRLGFQIETNGLFFSRLVGAYQRHLMASLHPRGTLRFNIETHRGARRVWLTREMFAADREPIRA